MGCEACRRRSEALAAAGTFGEVVRLIASRDFWFNSRRYEAGGEVRVTENAARHLKALGHAREDVEES